MGRIGQIPWNKGMVGQGEGHPSWNKGIKGRYFERDDSYLLGNQHAKGHKPNATCFKPGLTPWNKGLKGVMVAWNKGISPSEEQREKFRLAKLGKTAPQNAGENSHFWKGGIACEPYTSEWTRALKVSIRMRDDFTCRICGEKPTKCVHHIDYNKKNVDTNNLVTLCRRCHSLTTMHREKWLRFFTQI